MKRWDKSITGALIGMFLVGCSLLSVQRSPAEQDLPAGHAMAQALRPGLTPVMVQNVSASGATIAWKSTWAGRSQVVYGQTPRLMPGDADKSAATTERQVKLSMLKPGTRYYFQVETQTALGVARSAVLSFRTH
jgi:hypothetical protein